MSRDERNAVFRHILEISAYFCRSYVYAADKFALNRLYDHLVLDIVVKLLADLLSCHVLVFHQLFERADLLNQPVEL